MAIKKSKIKAKASLIVQVPAGADIDVLIEDGIIYVPMCSVELSGSETTSGDADAKPAKKAAAPAEEKPAPKKKVSASVKALTPLVKEWVDEAPDDDSDFIVAVKKLTDDKEKKKALAAKISEFSDSEDEFENEDLVNALAEIIDGGEAAEEKPAAEVKKGPGSLKKKAAAEEEPAEVDPDDLEVGNKVSVYWKSMKDWIDGEVKSVSKKGVLVYYAVDESEEYLNADENPKVKLISKK